MTDHKGISKTIFFLARKKKLIDEKSYRRFKTSVFVMLLTVTLRNIDINIFHDFTMGDKGIPKINKV